jgi:mRNA-degrading endonuclease RelE of RelBE toxin-antitoxin system
MLYEPEYTKRFLRDLRRYASLRKRVKKQIERILEDPLASSKLLTKKRTDWRGKRSQRVTRNFRVFFVICDECLKRSFKRKGYNACTGCEKTGSDNTVIFLAFGPHSIYDEEPPI